MTAPILAYLDCLILFRAFVLPPLFCHIAKIFEQERFNALSKRFLFGQQPVDTKPFPL